MNPIESYFGLAAYFSIMFIIIGFSEIINALSGMKHHQWGLTLTMGVLDAVIGFLLLWNLGWAAEVLPYLVAFILMFKGIDFIGSATQLRSLGITNWGWLLVAGILTVLFAFLIIFHPLFGVFNIVVWTGLAFVFGGVAAIVYAFAFRPSKCI